LGGVCISAEHLLVSVADLFMEEEFVKVSKMFEGFCSVASGANKYTLFLMILGSAGLVIGKIILVVILLINYLFKHFFLCDPTFMT